MKNTKKIKAGILGLSMVFAVSCAQSENDTLATEANTNKIEQSLVLTEMMVRDSSLSYDEYEKLQLKFDGLKIKYEADKKDFATLLKLAEIYIYEARVSGEHPYYYSAALNTINYILGNKVELSQDQLFTALFYKSTVQLSQHNFNEALVSGKEAMAMNDKNAGIYGVLVDANVEIGNYDKAVEMCDKMLEIRPDLRSYSRTSYLREIHGDIAGSKKAMSDAINAGAPYSEYKCWAIITLGKIYENEGQLDSAMICYDFALQERENYPFAIAGKAGVNAKRGNITESELLYDKSIKILPEIGFNIELAKLKKLQGETAIFQKMTEEIEVMFNEDIASGHNMNLEYANFLYSFKDDYKQALEYGLKELSSRPNNIDVNKLLAFVYYGMDNQDVALLHLEKAMATDKIDADMICLKGLLNKDSEMINKSFELNPFQDHKFANKALAIKNV